ncbi:DUF4124 domain-containing protein [Hydrogenophaga soli]
MSSGHERNPHGPRAPWRPLALAGLGVCLPLLAGAQGIYVCTDAHGRRITSDRPIPECADREQRELSPSGLVKRVIPGAISAQEQAQRLKQAEREAEQEAEQRAREREQQRKDRALLTRYTSQRQHDAEREKQLAMVDTNLAVIQNRTLELQQQAKGYQEEMEFYKADPTKAPAWLKRRMADNMALQEQQQQLVAAQLEEAKRVNARFDEELVRLKALWAARGTPSAPR